MQSRLNNNRKFYNCFIIILTFTFFLCGCSTSNKIIINNDKSITQIMNDINDQDLESNRYTHLYKSQNKNLPMHNLNNYNLVTENDSLGLYLEKDRASIRVLDKKSGYVWGTFDKDVPDNLNDSWACFGSSIVSMECIDSTGMTKKISAELEESKFKYKNIDDGIACRIDFGSQYKISLTVEIKLYKDHLSYSVNDTTISEGKDYFINKLYFSPFFGCVNSDDTEGYMFIPDGCGALIRYQKPMQILNSYSSRVYGLDQSIDNTLELNDLVSNRPKEFLTKSNTVSMPVYGLTHGVLKNALFGCIKSGAPYAYIEAVPAGFMTDYNWVTSSFLYRQTYLQPTTKNGTGVPMLQKSRNKVNPELDIYFLNGKDADYNGMATLYSDILVQNKNIPKEINNYVPDIVCDFIVSDASKALIGHKTKTLTTKDYFIKSVNKLNSKGIKNMAVSLLGWQKGGMSGYDKSHIFSSQVWGNFSCINNLKKSLKKNKSELFYYVDPLTAKNIQINPRQDLAIKMSQSPVIIKCLEDDRFLGDTYYIKGKLGLDILVKQNEVLNKHNNNISVDNTDLLYGDYLNNKVVTRSKMISEQQKAYSALSKTNDTLMLYRPNDYLWKYTGVYREIPMSCNQEIYETDTVPFMQLVLSGHIRLISPYINKNFFSIGDILKCMEYNVYPSFILTEEDNQQLAKTSLWTINSSQFDQWESIIYDTYSKIKKVLDPVKGQKMKNHIIIAKSVYKITYESGEIYINYGDNDYTVSNEISIPAKSGMYVPNAISK